MADTGLRGARIDRSQRCVRVKHNAEADVPAIRSEIERVVQALLNAWGWRIVVNVPFFLSDEDAAGHDARAVAGKLIGRGGENVRALASRLGESARVFVDSEKCSVRVQLREQQDGDGDRAEAIVREALNTACARNGGALPEISSAGDADTDDGNANNGADDLQTPFGGASSLRALASDTGEDANDGGGATVRRTFTPFSGNVTLAASVENWMQLKGVLLQDIVAVIQPKHRLWRDDENPDWVCFKERRASGGRSESELLIVEVDDRDPVFHVVTVYLSDGDSAVRTGRLNAPAVLSRTAHAEERQRERGVSSHMVDEVVANGIPHRGRGGVTRYLQGRTPSLSSERGEQTVVVADGDTVITTYKTPQPRFPDSRRPDASAQFVRHQRGRQRARAREIDPDV